MAILLTGCGFGKKTYAPKTATSRPYKISNSHMKNKWFYPKDYYEHDETGYASYYGGRDKIFDGRKTSTGEVFHRNKLVAAHRTLPLPSMVRVTNLENGRSIKLRVIDRGPFAHINKRIIDVSEKAAKLLGFHRKGVAKVRIQSLVGDSLRLAKGKKVKTPHRVVSVKKKPRKIKVGKSRIQLASLNQKNLRFLQEQKILPKKPPKKRVPVQKTNGLPSSLFRSNVFTMLDKKIKLRKKPRS